MPVCAAREAEAWTAIRLPRGLVIAGTRDRIEGVDDGASCSVFLHNNRSHREVNNLLNRQHLAPVAQLDRASAYGNEKTQKTPFFPGFFAFHAPSLAPRKPCQGL